MTSRDTIYALGSGALPAGIGVVRLSGPLVTKIIEDLTGNLPEARLATLKALRSSKTGETLDKALVLWFPGPNSFTGEDVAEFHCHGGRAVVQAIFNELSESWGCRMAEPGEFTERAFKNNKLNLLEVEGLGDLINAETESQRKLAQKQHLGQFSQHYETWRKQITRARGLLEAELDFPDEEDVPGSVSDQVWTDIERLIIEIEDTLARAKYGERIRDGVSIVLAGPPNVGKSSLLNLLAKRDVAIVSPIEGTTRDVLEVHLDLNGVPVKISDTAGLRSSADMVERIGIDRARQRLKEADLVVYLSAVDVEAPEEFSLKDDETSVLRVLNKTDLPEASKRLIRDRYDLEISIKEEQGLENLIGELTERAAKLTGVGEELLITRTRHQEALAEGVKWLKAAVVEEGPLELKAENLRLASDALGRVLGLVGVEDLLDIVFREFCIGK